MADVAPKTQPPLEVPVKSWPGLGEQGVQTIAVAGCGLLADRFFHHNDVVQGYAASTGVILAWAWGAVRHVRTVGMLRALNDLVPDDKARAKA